MAAFAEELLGLSKAPESFDPADLEDDLGDDTTARKKRRISSPVIDLEHDKRAPVRKKRLQMRQSLPVLEQYKGKQVARKDVFGEEESGSGEEMGDPPPIPSEDDSDDLAGDDMLEPTSAGDLGNFKISGDLEKEYERMMKKSQTELSVLRAPSAAEVARKDAEAKQLKQQVSAWSALVEFRIHLESAMSIAHRLPVADAYAAARDVGGEAVANEVENVAKEARNLLGTLLDLQHNMAQKRGLSSASAEKTLSATQKHAQESSAWSLVDAQLQQCMDWGLGVADEWKERTRLDARRSFKVLDQSLSSQMRASSEIEPEKLRKRCTPPPGRHQVLGAPSPSAASSEPATSAEGKGAAAEEQDIFDDREFYVQLLRESLASGDRQAASEENRELQLELQGRRASKKRNRAEVERRASKGRKIRYVPIEKLQNFVSSRPRSGVSGDSADPFLGGQAGVDALLRSLFSSAHSS